ncbi:MAG: hypothetical protein Q7U44_10860, partial [Desulfuromonadales bacterium]|nr:hypothetical protein [Desulfuromonadales bacterium]
VATGAAVDVVAALPAGEAVVAGAAEQSVVAVPADELVVAGVAGDVVGDVGAFDVLDAADGKIRHSRLTVNELQGN